MTWPEFAGALTFALAFVLAALLLEERKPRRCEFCGERRKPLSRISADGWICASCADVRFEWLDEDHD